jgi:hypothetical protein
MPAAPDLDVAHPNFVAALKASNKHTEQVAAWLRRIGRHVVVHPLHIRPSARDRLLYADGGDLTVSGMRVEVKQRAVDFETAAQWPFPTLIVDSVSNFERKEPKPVAYIITNHKVTACFIVDVRTRDLWTKVSRQDGRTKMWERFYELPRSAAIFRKMA